MMWQHAIKKSKVGAAFRKSKYGGLVLRFSDGDTVRLYRSHKIKRPYCDWDEHCSLKDWFPLSPDDIYLKLIEIDLTDLN